MFVILVHLDQCGEISRLLVKKIIKEFRGLFPSYTGLLMSFCPINKLSSLFCKHVNETSILQRTDKFFTVVNHMMEDFTHFFVLVVCFNDARSSLYYLALNTSAARNVSSHFEYLENRSRGLDITWQPVRGDLTVQS